MRERDFAYHGVIFFSIDKYRKEVKMKKINWWIVGIVIAVIALFLFGGGMMWGNRGYGMMGNMMGGYGMMHRGFSPLGWFGMGLGMIFMWLIPIGILVLIGFGVASLVRNTGNPPQASSLTPCSNCGKGTQADWQTCPYCGNSLK